MSTTSQRGKPALTADTRVSSYDRTSSLLVACVIIVGFLVTVMFLIWLTIIVDFSGIVQPPMMQELAGNYDRPEGIADDWQEPGVEEFPEVEVPQLATALEAVTAAVSSVQAQLEKYDGNALKMGRGKGLGDIRQRGPGGGNSAIIPEAKRWKIEYAAATMVEYLTILDHFKVTLGAVSQVSNQIYYLPDLLQSSDVVTGLRKDEQRIYFMNNKNRLRRWDTNKIQSAGVDPKNKLVVQFYEPDVRQVLRELERAYHVREGRQLIEVQQTIFRVRPVGRGYEYYVENITYRAPPK